MKNCNIGLISDTHNLLRPEALIALQGVDRIIHSGDICSESILRQLAQIAPVLAVRGNNDRGEWANELREEETLEIAGVTIYVVHDRHAMRCAPEEAGVQVVVSGHSHRPGMSKERGVLYINPGSAGPRRFRLPVSLGFLEIADGAVRGRVQVLAID